VFFFFSLARVWQTHHFSNSMMKVTIYIVESMVLSNNLARSINCSSGVATPPSYRALNRLCRLFQRRHMWEWLVFFGFFGFFCLCSAAAFFASLTYSLGVNMFYAK